MRWLRDRRGNVMGNVQSEWSGKVAYDANGNVVGRYNASEDRTYDASGNYVGEGDMLSGLIMESVR